MTAKETFTTVAEGVTSGHSGPTGAYPKPVSRRVNIATR
jgi:hypothetical protein